MITWLISFQIVLRSPDTINFHPKPKSSRKDFQENCIAGIQRLKTHRNTVLSSWRLICCPTRLHTPMPHSAIPIPTTPLAPDDISDTLVCVLKSTRLVRVVLWTIAAALMTTITDIARINGTSSGSSRNLLTGPAVTAMTTARSRLSTMLKMKVVL